MPEIQIVKVDEGGVNARILAKEAKRSGVCGPAFENPTVVVGCTEKQAETGNCTRRRDRVAGGWT